MRAAVTEGREQMRVVDVNEPGDPGPGEVLIRPEAVGLCGSDFHYFLGDVGAVGEADRFPRIQGHEASAVVEAVGPDCPPYLEAGVRIAIWPHTSCGDCYPCRIGRGNACVHLNLIGIHRDGALQERLVIPAEQAFPVGDQDAVSAAIVEPMSIAVRAVVRGRVAPGEKVVVFGAGPIGQAVAVAAADRGGSVLLIDPVESRLERGQATGADTLHVEPGADPVPAVREWAGGDGPEVVFEATGVADVAQTAVELVASAGRVVIVGLGTTHAPLEIGRLAFKEVDVLGTSTLQRGRLRRSDLPRRPSRGGARRLRHARVLARGSARGDRVRDAASCRRDEGRDQAGRGLVTLRALDERRAAAMEALCELIVPGSSSVGPVVYVDALLAGMPPPVQEAALAAIDALAPAAEAGRRGARRARGNARVRVRARARDRGVLQRLRRAREPGARARGRRSTSTRRSRRGSRRTGRTWGSHEGPVRRRRRRVRRRRRRRRGRARAARSRRPPARVRAAPDRGGLHALGGEGDARPLLAAAARAAAGEAEVVAFLAGRCVGGTTTINTKVALRAHERDVAKWHAGDRPDERRRRALRPRPTSTRTTTGSSSVSACASARTGRKSVYTRRAGLSRARRRARGGALVHRRELHALRLVPPGLPDERGQVDDEHVHPRRLGARAARAARERERRAGADRGLARRPASSTSTPEATRHTVRAGAVVVAAGTLNTPQLLLRSGMTGEAIGRNLGLHPVRLVYGLFDEPQDAHMVYPITAHCMDHQHDEDGGFVIEATTIQDPIAFATTLCDEQRAAVGSSASSTRSARFRHWIGVLAMVNDENNASVVARRGRRRAVRDRLRAAASSSGSTRRSQFCRDVLEAAGAKQVCWTRPRLDARPGQLPDGRRPGARRSSTGTASRTR